MREVLHDPDTLVQHRVCLRSADFTGKTISRTEYTSANTALLPPISDFHSFQCIYLNFHQERQSLFGWTEALRELKPIAAEWRIQSESPEPLAHTIPSKHPLQLSGVAPEHSPPGHSRRLDRLQLGRRELLLPHINFWSYFMLNLPLLKRAHVWGNGTSALSTSKGFYCRYLHVVHRVPQTLKLKEFQILKHMP